MVTPLHGVEYAEQLKRKREGLLQALRKLPAEMATAARSVPEHAKGAFRSLTCVSEATLKANQNGLQDLGNRQASKLSVRPK